MNGENHRGKTQLGEFKVTRESIIIKTSGYK